MGSSVVDPDLRLALVLLALTAIAAVAGRFAGLGVQRPVLVAAARATVQLAVVSAVLLAVVESLVLSTAFVLLMTGIATITAAGRVTGRPLRSPGARDRLPATALPITGGAAPVVLLVLASGTVPFRGEAVIPIAGILIGGAMTATSPPLDQTRTVGLVTLPGAYVGVLLCGGTPLEAGAAQLLVLLGLLAAEMLAVRAVTEPVARGALLERVPR